MRVLTFALNFQLERTAFLFDIIIFPFFFRGRCRCGGPRGSLKTRASVHLPARQKQRQQQKSLINRPSTGGSARILFKVKPLPSSGRL